MEAFVLIHFRPFDLFIFLRKLQKLQCSSDFFSLQRSLDFLLLWQEIVVLGP